MNSNKFNLFCPECNGSKSLSFFLETEPHLFCHKCNYIEFNEDKIEEYFSTINTKYNSFTKGNKQTMTEKTDNFPVEGSVAAIPHRGLNEDTCKLYKVETLFKLNPKTNLPAPIAFSFPFFNKEEAYVAQKIKYKNKKDTPPVIKGTWSSTTLFGQHIFPAGCSRDIIITEGEEDAMAAHQMISNDKYYCPVVSIRNGAQSAKKDCQIHWEYLNSFQNIIICFDNDEPGKKASLEVADLFPNKAKVMRLEAYKDANEYLLANEEEAFRRIKFGAEKILPQGILSSKEVWDEMNKTDSALTVPYPWKGLQDMLYGMRTGELVVWKAMPKAGKCFGKGTMIRMWDGTVKAVEDIVKGDVLMGDDGTSRNVESTVTGVEELFRVTQTKRDSYVVNKSHIMCLKNTDSKKVIDIPLEEYFTMPEKVRWKGYAAPILREETYEFPLPSYLLGIWLGDGSKNEPKITSADSEIVEYIKEYAKSVNLRVSTQKEIDYYLGGTKNRPNPFTEALRELNVWDNKHIPVQYLTATMKERLHLLAGLIDSDGHYSVSPERGVGSYEITQKLKPLAEGILALARSCGFKASIVKTNKCCTHKEQKVCGDYYRLQITGELSKIPVKLPRKKAIVSKTGRVRDPLVCGIEVESIGEGVYFGFVIDGNHRFLLEDFTVVHNTQLFRALSYHIKTTSTYNVGLIFLEDTTKRIGMGMCSLQMAKNLQIPDTIYTLEELKQAHEELFGDDRFFIFDPRAERTAENVLNKITHFVKAYDVKFIFLDHVSMLAYDNLEGDERRFLDKLFKDLKDATVTLDVHISAITHVNDDGKARGSRASYQLCDALVSLERDKLNPDEVIANTLNLIVEENRVAGTCGKASALYFNKDTAHFSELNPDETMFEQEPQFKKVGLKFDD